MAARLKKLLRFHPYQSKRRQSTPEISAPMCPESALAHIWEEQESLVALAGVTSLRRGDLTLSPIALRRSATPGETGSGGRRHCCKWDMDRRARRQDCDEILESTRISQCDSAMLDRDLCLPSLLTFMEREMTPRKREISRVMGIRPETPRVKQDDYRGQLKLSVYVNSGLLTVHIVQGRHFSSKYKPMCDTSVKVSLIPAAKDNTSCETDVIRDSNHPLYEEKFSFELLSGDRQKSVLVSVYHNNTKTGRDELLGCMSFRVQKITASKTPISGWYFLLSEGLGHRKHSLVTSQEPDIRPLPHVLEAFDSPVRFRPYRLLIRRNSSGYGFTMTGGCPAKVSRVEPGGPAHRAGLRTGDVIIKLNREQVYTAAVEGVARIIKHSAKKILLDVQRPHKSGPEGRPSPWQPAYSDLDLSTCSSSGEEGESSLSGGWCGQGEDKENCPVMYQAFSNPAAKRVRFQDF